jgi:glycosyltransferase involved in cell wall biosynthesis
LGAGDCHAALVAERDRLGLDGVVDLPGRVPDETVAGVLSAAAVGVCPDPKNPLNDVSTMNKTMEYMAFALPVVAFDLVETRVSAQDAAVYAAPGDVDGFAQAIVDLVDDPDRRAGMGRRARERVVSELAWEHQRAAYLRVYDELVGRAADGPVGEDRVPVAASAGGE